tara:strand:+ start:61738 stop:62052 length:315 start_codon:yes stop_codon:yes gene_type:complete
MRITENHLRRIIRSVIKESSGSNEKNHILSQMSPAAQACIRDAEGSMMTADLVDDLTSYMSNLPDPSMIGSEVSHEDILLMNKYLNIPDNYSVNPSTPMFKPTV